MAASRETTIQCILERVALVFKAARESSEWERLARALQQIHRAASLSGALAQDGRRIDFRERTLPLVCERVAYVRLPSGEGSRPRGRELRQPDWVER